MVKIDESQKPWSRRITDAEWDSIFGARKSLDIKALPKDGHHGTPKASTPSSRVPNERTVPLPDAL